MNSLKKIPSCIAQNTSARTISRSTSIARMCSYFPKIDERPSRDSAIKDAERVVGCPTSFSNLRWILNEELINVATHVRKLIGTNHPLLKIAKSFLLGNERDTWGLVVLLMSKVAGLRSNFGEFECDRTAGILYSQRVVAEVTEMIRTSHLMHDCIINIKSSTENRSDMKIGNGVALLFGDHLLSTSSTEIVRLRNFHVQELMSSALRDLAESQFMGLRDDQNRAIPSKPLPVQHQIDIPLEFGVEPFQPAHVLGNMEGEWTLRNVLGGGSLLAKGCQSSLILANHGSRVQELGHAFGRSFALAWKASLEKDLINEETFSLVSASVMFHLEHDPGFYAEIEKLAACENIIDYDSIRKVVKSGPGLERTFQLQNTFANTALNVLENFPDSAAKTALRNITMAL